MPEPIDPVRPVKEDRRNAPRRRGERRTAGQAVVANLPAVIAQPEPAPAPTSAAVPGPSAFAAQVLGQSGQKRGLRGGPPVLDAARSTYLETEWSGPNDRRPGRGAVAKTHI